MRISRTVLLLIPVALLVAAVLLWFRPWGPYPPAAMSNLFDHEQSVENFRNMDRIFPYREIRATAPPRPLPRAEGSLPETFEHDGETISTAEFIERTRTTGLLVLHEGRIQVEQYRLGAGPHSQLTSWSVAKTFVAALTGIALDQGHIRSLDDPVREYVEEFAETAWAEVRLRDLLRMASGIAFDERYDARFSDIQRLFYQVFLLDLPVDEVVRDLARAGEPGEAFSYISPNTQVLARVLREATGESLTDYLERELWHPLGMEHDAFWNLGRDGTELAFCCLNVTLRDYARFGQLYLQQGSWNERRILPENWVHKSTRRPEPWLEPGRADPERGYGYHLWIPGNAEAEYLANGIWGQGIWVSENHDVVIARAAADPNFKAHIGETISFMRALSTHASEQCPEEDSRSCAWKPPGQAP